ncbi:MAG TPA: HAD-IIIC family phosphatase, partial [Caulobacteraceae bacterium]|nr:HAD-IIIC family phosphatase [Caulobacteraceae bacterium]
MGGVPMTCSFIDLPWLPQPPGDFDNRLRALGNAGGPTGALVQQLATTRLAPRQSAALGRAMSRLRAAGADFAPLSGFRLGVLASSTYDLALDGLAAAAARHGVLVEIVRSPYDQVAQQALDPGSEINVAQLDAVLVAVDHRWLGLDRPNFADPAAVRARAAVERLRSVGQSLLKHGAAPIFQTIPVPPGTLFGSLDRRIGATARAAIDEANRLIATLAEELGGYLLDLAALTERVGADRWFDPLQWAAYKLPFAAECAPAWAEMVGRLLGAIRGRSRKCLVLDLDNTLWGGVIGDDGPDGIVLGQGGALAESFLAVQQAALDLRDRGIVLAVCSKNDEAVARGPFRDHREMLLREHHIGVFQANWLDKAANLEAIAAALDIGVDALVLLDDNPAERAQVRAALPQVAVPELPQDPAWFAWTLGAAGYFEAVSVSEEDLARADAYATQAARAEAKAGSRDLGEYLTSLGMVVRFSRFDASGRQRIAQLINKTNQFNLTTRRYTEAEVATFEQDGAAFTLQARLRDRFGDLGMISVVICRAAADAPATWEIDTWLMSCRVLGRELERAVLGKIVGEARSRKVGRLIGSYIPSGRNSMVADHYRKLGFVLVA